MWNIIILCLALFELIGCNEKKEQLAELVVAMDMSFPPFEGIGLGGEPYGISVDLAHDLAKSMGKTARIINVNWEGLIPSLRTNQCDIILSSLSITSAREKIVDFSIPYGQLGIEILTRKDFEFTSIEDLNNPKIRINVRRGTVSEIVGMDRFPKAQLVRLADFDSAILEILQNKADIVLCDPLTAFEYYKKYPKELVVRYHSLGVVPMAIAVAKTKNKILLTQINEFLAEYRQQGKFLILADKYLGEIKEDFEKQGHPFSIIF